MPTSRTENEKIIDICMEYTSLPNLHNMAVRLDEEVGKVSDNDSVKQTMAALRAMVEAIVQSAYSPGHPQVVAKD